MKVVYHPAVQRDVSSPAESVAVAGYFKVRGVDGREYLLKHDLESDQWYLGRQW
jgi:hypothetical protein